MLHEHGNGADTTPAKAGRKQNGRFQKGVSGNPRGRRQGSRHKATIAMEVILDGEAEKLTRKAVEMALNGDATAMRLVMERLLPPRRTRPVRLSLPEIHSATDVDTAVSAVIQSMAVGDMTPDDAGQIAAVLEVRRRSIATVEIYDRLKALEARAQAA